jgi:hypothetical protein
MKTSKLIVGLAFSVLASTTFAIPAFADNSVIQNHATRAAQVASDGADHAGTNRLASDGADHVGANRVS